MFFDINQFDIIKWINTESLNIDLSLMEFFNDSISNSWNILYYIYCYQTDNYFFILMIMKNLYNLIDTSFIDLYYKNSNELLNYDSKLIHPIINDLSSVESLHVFQLPIDSNYISVLLDSMFLVLGINWSNQNLMWNFWWIWDLSEIITVISLIFGIIQLHEDDDNDDDSLYFHDFFYSDDDKDDSIIVVFILYFFIIQMYNVSHSFIDNPQTFIYIWFMFLIVNTYADYWEDDDFNDINEYQLRIRNNKYYFLLDILFIGWVVMEFQTNTLIIFIYYLLYSNLIIYNIFNIYNITKIKFILIHFIGIIIFSFFKNSSINFDSTFNLETSWNHYNNILSFMSSVTCEDYIVLTSISFETSINYINTFYCNIITYLINMIQNSIKLIYYNTNHFLDYILFSVFLYYFIYFKKCNII